MILEKIKKLVGSLSILALLVSIFPTSALAASPRFNFLADDKELLRAANDTRGDQTWSSSISGNAGDVFSGIIYYHNGVIDTVAKNTRVKVSIPEQTTGKKATFSASILADNASTVSNNLELTLDADANISFVPGSVRWYPNHNEVDDQSEPLPYGQSGDELISSNGLRIGDIQGCWNYAGFVTFKFKTIKQSVSIVKSKIAKNLRTGETGTDIKAMPGDKIEYALTTANNGNAAAAGVIVSDDISDILEYADLENSNAYTLSQGVISWQPVNILPGVSVVNKFTVQVKNPLPNLPASGIHYDFKMQNVYGNWVFVTITETPKTPVLSIKKSVRNATQNEVNFVKENTALAGDTLEYQIEFANTGNAPADGVVICDVIPANTQYMSGTTVISINGGQERTYSDALGSTGLTISLEPGESGYIKFRVLTSTQIAANEVLINTVYLKYGDKTISDIAKTTVTKVIPPKQPELPVTGAESLIITALTAILAAVGYVYYRRKKVLDKMLKTV